jgi:peptidoglycan hydrolase CwlO-like protein
MPPKRTRNSGFLSEHVEENTPETVLHKGMEYLARIDAELKEDRTELAELERKVEAMRDFINEKKYQLDEQREDVERLEKAMGHSTADLNTMNEYITV